MDVPWLSGNTTIRSVLASTPRVKGVLRSNNIPAAPKYPSSSKSMVVPDLSAIHKALFTNK
ncbi:hypothetical protein J6590_090557 [Homalodisca vitripennis]|nr:hypothetical protein J6590_090557 [Homalodisca vitripennis]